MINLESELKNCFSVTNADENSGTLEVTLPKDLVYFRGHFPGFPVLPAVAFVDLSLFFVETIFSRQQLSPQFLKTVRHIKIKKPLPDSVPVLILLTKGENQRVEIDWQDYAQISLEFSV